MSATEIEVREFRTNSPVGDQFTLSSKPEGEVIDYLRSAGYVDMRAGQGEAPMFVLVLWRVSGGFVESSPPKEWIGQYCNPEASLEQIRQVLCVLHKGG